MAQHFHDGTEDDVKESDIPDDPVSAVSYFLSFVRENLTRLRQR
jgi:hypothetical protein